LVEAVSAQRSAPQKGTAPVPHGSSEKAHAHKSKPGRVKQRTESKKRAKSKP
jgi:hypothetical protein